MAIKTITDSQTIIAPDWAEYLGDTNEQTGET